MWGLLNDPLAWLLGILYTLPALVVGFTVHEFCHAAVAVKLGDVTPRLEGRMTLNPSAHIDGLGLLLFVLLGWGYAKPVRIVPGNLRGRRWGEAAVALAGPVSNFVVAALFYALWSLLPAGAWSTFLYYGATVNLTLCFLNLLPVPPLDGFSVLKAFLPLRYSFTLARLQSYGLVALVLLSFIGVLGKYLGAMQSVGLMLFARLFG